MFPFLCPIFCTRESWFEISDLYIRRQSPAEHALLSTRQLACPDGETVVAFCGSAIHLQHFHFSPAHQTIVRDGLERMHKGANASCRLLKASSIPNVPQATFEPLTIVKNLMHSAFVSEVERPRTPRCRDME